MRNLRAFLRAIGPFGVAGLGVLFGCLPLYFSALQPVERELAALQASSAQHRTAGMVRVALDGREAELAGFQALFPAQERSTDELERLYRLARAAGLELMQGEYRVDKRAAGLVAYRVALPVRGSYPQLRAFVGSVLTEMPTASVDALRFERKKSGESQLEAQVRLTLHLRPSGETE
jgi:hypothetical protein